MMQRTFALLLLATLGCSPADEPGSAPPPSGGAWQIQFTGLEPGDRTVSGTVTHANASTPFVVLYAKTDRYYVQPSPSEALSPVARAGTWQTTTAEWDQLIALAVDETFHPAAVLDTHPHLQAGVRASVDLPPTRAVHFGDRDWLVKSGELLGPGPNYFSDSAESVWVDDAGLHLRIRPIDGVWHAAEVVLPTESGYGVYEYTISSPLVALDGRTVLSGFLYESDAKEIDIEFSTGLAGLNSAQYVVQPHFLPGHLRRFEMAPVTPTHHRITWSPSRVEFASWFGGSPNPTEATTIASWVYDGADVPVPGAAHMRFNAWLLGGDAPSSGIGDELVVESFAYRALPGIECPGGIVGDAGSQPEVSILGLDESGTRLSGYASNLDASSRRIVVYAKTNHWFVQPFADQPYTDICSDGSWSTFTRQGDTFVALVVDESYVAAPVLVSHPSETAGVLAWDQFPGGCTNVGVIGSLSLPPSISIVGLNRGDSVVRGMVNNVDADRARVALFAYTDLWHPQPFLQDPLTAICSPGQWENTTHSWNRIVALLVDEAFVPPGSTPDHPSTRAGVLAWDEYPSRCSSTGFIGDPSEPPRIEITVAESAHIEGTAANIDNGEIRVVLWAKTNIWYVQPFTAAKFTSICLDGSWENFTHPWNSIVALLVDRTYDPPDTQTTHPSSAAGVLAFDQVDR